jgi:isoleucyl-tRNA synthetase
VTNGTLRAGAYILSRGEFTLEYAPRDGWEVKHEDEYVVGVDTRLDDELETEGQVYDLIHAVQRLRRDAGLEVTDRIVLTVPASDEDLLAHKDWIAAETLAQEVEVGDELAVRKAA